MKTKLVFQVSLNFEPEPLSFRMFITSLIYPLHKHSVEKRKQKKNNNLGTSSIFHEFSFSPEPLFPWSIDQAAVLYLPPGATAAISWGTRLAASHAAMQGPSKGPPTPSAPYNTALVGNWNHICTSVPRAPGGVIGKPAINFLSARPLAGALWLCFLSI